MQIRLASEIQYDSIVDGEGIRAVIWMQGCPHHCKGCHNPLTHSLDGGYLVDIEDVKESLAKNNHQDGITLTGGDPLIQPEACYEIASYAKKIGLNVWCYTGYTYEQIIAMSKHKPIYLELLKVIDILIDGKFVLNLKSMDLKFRGSSNQRIIDVAKSLDEGKAVVDNRYNTSIIGQDLYKKPKDIFI